MSKQRKRCYKYYNIAMVSDYFYPNLGGIESHIELLSKALINLGHKVIIITHAYDGYEGIKILNDIKVYYLNIPVIAMNTTFPNLLSNTFTLYDIYKSEEINVVHGHQTMSSLALEALFHAKTLNLKCILTEHSLFEVGGFENILVNRLAELILRDIDYFISVSFTSKINLMNRLNLKKTKVKVIPNAVDKNKFYNNNFNDETIIEEVNKTDNQLKYDNKFIIDKEIFKSDLLNTGSETNNYKNKADIKSICNNKKIKNQFNDKSKNIICISRLVKRKGVELLINLIPYITKTTDLNFIIAGNGPLKHELEQMIDKYQIEHRVLLLGEIENDDVNYVLNLGCIFLNTSLTEAFCIAVLEAAFCGLTVVSTNVGGIHEVLPKECVILTGTKIEDLANGISQARKMKHKNKEIKRIFSWNRVAKKTIKLYDQIINSELSFIERLNHYHWFTEFVCRIFIAVEYALLFIYDHYCNKNIVQ